MFCCTYRDFSDHNFLSQLLTSTSPLLVALLNSLLELQFLLSCVKILNNYFFMPETETQL